MTAGSMSRNPQSPGAASSTIIVRNAPGSPTVERRRKAMDWKRFVARALPARDNMRAELLGELNELGIGYTSAADRLGACSYVSDSGALRGRLRAVLFQRKYQIGDLMHQSQAAMVGYHGLLAGGAIFAPWDAGAGKSS